MPKQLTKKRRPDEWKVPPIIRRSDVRAHLAAITRHVAAGNQVFVGTSENSAFSVFVSESDFKQREKSLPIEAEDIDIESLRTNWSQEREQVENTGLALRILRKRVCVAYFVPTPLALEKKVSRTLEILNMSHINLLHQLDHRVDRLEATVRLLSDAAKNNVHRKEGLCPIKTTRPKEQPERALGAVLSRGRRS